MRTNLLNPMRRLCLTVLLLPMVAAAQSVILPAPRLLTTMPMGGQAGTTFGVTVTGDFIDGEPTLHFSHPGITAKRTGENRYSVTIAADAPAGIHEARLMTRLGISSTRAFTVGAVPEVLQKKPNQTLAQAMPLKLGSVCNAAISARAVDYFSFRARAGQRVVVECAAKGIDSRMNAVLIIADAEGRDLKVDRLGGLLDFTAPADGQYIIKVHELTYKGGAHYFYRLVLSEVAKDAPAPRHPAVDSVSSFSWRPEFAPPETATPESEPNNQQAQAISLPCHVTGRFFPAADVDTFEFTAKAGETWWVEVVSERLGLPTDPFVLVQHIGSDGKLTDVAELNDIAPPIKPSSNGYSYDGPPYNAGSADVLGKFTVKTAGKHRLQLRDLFGGTRSIARHRYRLIVRRAAPDFTLAAWALHMNLRNGDRAAFSKPVALRNGRTMAFEVVRVNRDGFSGPVDLAVEGLPAGMSGQGFRMKAGQTRGIVTITAADNAPRTLGTARIIGRAVIDGKTVTRPCRLASMKWPVRDASSDIPAPRLLADFPVSVGGAEPAPITIRAAEQKIYEAKAGTKLVVPLKVVRRGEFSGAAISLRAFGPGFERCTMEANLKSDQHNAELDLAALKVPPGEHTIAFYGKAVSKYGYNPTGAVFAQTAKKKAEAAVKMLEAKVKSLTEVANAKPGDAKAAAALKTAAAQLKTAQAASTRTATKARTASSLASKRDIVDIVVSEPVTIRVLPAAKQDKK